MAMDYLDKAPAGWSTLVVLRTKSNAWDWCALVSDTPREEYQARHNADPSWRPQEAYVRIAGKHRNEEAALRAWQYRNEEAALRNRQHMTATRH